MHMPTNTIENLFTMPEIAKLLRVEQHRLTYLIRARAIEPAAKKAGIRLFTYGQAQHMASELGVPVADQPSMDSVPRPSEASVASPSVDVSPVDATPVDATPVSVGGPVVYDASDSQLRPDEDETPRFNAQQPKPGRRKA